jgi:cbb3-type cytochrome oxidase subunit 3
MSATTFLSRIFLSLIFFVSNEHERKEEEEEEQGEVEEDNDEEEDEGDEVELLLACNNISARFIANSSYLHSNSPHHFLLQTQEVESVVVEVFSRVLSV